MKSRSGPHKVAADFSIREIIEGVDFSIVIRECGCKRLSVLDNKPDPWYIGCGGGGVLWDRIGYHPMCPGLSS